MWSLRCKSPVLEGREQEMRRICHSWRECSWDYPSSTIPTLIRWDLRSCKIICRCVDAVITCEVGPLPFRQMTLAADEHIPSWKAWNYKGCTLWCLSLHVVWMTKSQPPFRSVWQRCLKHRVFRVTVYKLMQTRSTMVPRRQAVRWHKICKAQYWGVPFFVRMTLQNSVNTQLVLIFKSLVPHCHEGVDRFYPCKL